jgi:hypothetical protein
MSNSKNDITWEVIFEKLKILDRILEYGNIEISATTINSFGREARLMTKFDHKSQLPKIFAENKLSILPTSRGGYVIGEFEAFCKFNSNDIAVTPIEFPTFLESLDYRDITSEATAINCAFVSKILHDFTNEENLFPTVSGRMSSSSFSFNINSPKGLFNINVGNSQVEIDGGYEGDSSLNLIEAKNYISSDFLIRQLYYPYKLWSGKIQKQVRPIFLTYSNGVFHLREYAFSNIEHYNSLVLVKQKKYAIQEGSFNLEALSQIIDTTKLLKEPEIPFPQADSFERVINLCELINQNQVMTKDQYLQDFDFGTIDPRQHDYYTNAARYLGLVDKIQDSTTKQTCFVLSKLGNQTMSVSLIERQKEFIKLILSHKPFRETLKMHLENGEMPNKENIVEIMKNSKLYNIGSETTYFRRASTIIGWTNWIINQTEE